MALLPEREESTVRSVYAALAGAHSETPRTYLGASVIGRPCPRQLWYDFRWCQRSDTKADGRMLRLWRYGHQLEDIVADDLRAAGCTVYTRGEDGEQFGFKDAELGNHLAGHMDGGMLGLVEAPKTWHVLECKSHNDKSFNDLVKKGVQESKPEHYAQCQLYMHWSGMTRAAYIAENKNTSELYIERIRYDAGKVEELRNKARLVIFSDEPPARISNKPEFYLCRWCGFSSLCFGENDPKALPRPSCRTCCHSTPKRDGDAAWKCMKFDADIPPEHAPAGCRSHVYHPSAVTCAGMDPVDADHETGTVTFSVCEEGLIKNGPGATASESIYKAAQQNALLMLASESAQAVICEFDAELMADDCVREVAIVGKD